MCRASTKRLPDAIEQPQHVNLTVVLKPNDDKTLVKGRHFPDNKGIRRVDGRDSLNINVGVGKLGNNIPHVVVHAIDDG